MQVGDRVKTPRGLGVIVYQRMRPPAFAEVEAYSVKLEGVSHTGVMYAPESLTFVEAAPVETDAQLDERLYGPFELRHGARVSIDSRLRKWADELVTRRVWLDAAIAKHVASGQQQSYYEHKNVVIYTREAIPASHAFVRVTFIET